MVPRRTGALLNVGSTAAFQPFPGQAGCAAAKAFVRTFSEGLRAELTGTAVTVAVLHPGPVRTEFLSAAGMDEREFADAFPKYMWLPPRRVAAIGIESLDQDKGSVIAGLPNQISTRIMQLIPRGILLKVLASRHRALKRDRASR
ncbi:hypothetical protein BH11ACT6_BH11ACT6_52990 [soil metagenome]